MCGGEATGVGGVKDGCEKKGGCGVSEAAGHAVAGGRGGRVEAESLW